MLYTIQCENKSHVCKIEDIFSLVKTDPNSCYVLCMGEKRYMLDNTLICKTVFVCHRVNTVAQLKEIDPQFGIEIDVRDCPDGELILSHDPFETGERFDTLLLYYHHALLILNIKSERIEIRCLDLLKKYGVNNYFFLDSSFPMVYMLNKKYTNNRIACRYSEFEPIDMLIQNTEMYTHVWIDCFTKFLFSKTIHDELKRHEKQTCIVSPELQGQSEKIPEYKEMMEKEGIYPDMICCKHHNILHWIIKEI